MNEKELKSKVQNIVKKATILKNKYIDDKNALVNYACIFSQSYEEYEELIKVVKNLGKIIKETPTGPLFQINSLKTVSGDLKLLKIRFPDITRPEKGDADFTISNYETFKKKYLLKKGFKLITRENFEMIELMDIDFDVRAYFSNLPLDKQLKINKL